MGEVILRTLRLEGFGRFRGKEITLEPGMNLLEGNNEAGKSTILAFLTGMLYGFYQPGARRRVPLEALERYRPWDGGSYGGVLVLEAQGRRWRIQRDFAQDICQVWDDETGEEWTSRLPYDSGSRLCVPGEALLGMSRTVFCNTVCVPQLGCQVGEELASQVSDKLVELSQSGEPGLSLQAVLERLSRQEEAIGGPRRSKSPYGQMVARQQELAQEWVDADRRQQEEQALRQQYQEWRGQLEEARRQLEQMEQAAAQQTAQQQKDRLDKAREAAAALEELTPQWEELSRWKDADPERLDQLWKKQESYRQISRTVEKYEQALEQLAEQLSQLEAARADLGVGETSPEEWEAMRQRQLLHQEEHQRLGRIQQAREAVQQELESVPFVEEGPIRQDLERCIDLEEEQPGPLESGWGRALLAVGLALVICGALCGLLWKPVWAAAAVPGVVCLAVVLSREILWRKQSSLRWQELSEILEQYQAPEEVEQVSQYLRQYLEQIHRRNLQSRQISARVDALDQEFLDRASAWQEEDQVLNRYLERLGVHGRMDDPAVWQELSKRWEESARLEQQAGQVRFQGNQILREEQQCRTQLDILLGQLEEGCRDCGLAGPEEIESSRRQRRLWEETDSRYRMERQRLEQALDGWTLEELEQQASQAPQGEEALPPAQKQELDQLRARCGELAEKTAQLDGTLQALEQGYRPTGRIRREQQELEEQKASWDLDLEALSLARERLGQLGEAVHRDLVPQLNEQVSQLVSQATEGRYSRAVVDRKLGVCLEQVDTGRMVPLSSLSSGAADLVSLSLRLGLAPVLCAEETPPLLLDDSFTQLDDQRLERVLAHLSRQLEEGHLAQVLLLSCHHREGEILSQSNIPVNRVELS